MRVGRTRPCDPFPDSLKGCAGLVALSLVSRPLHHSFSKFRGLDHGRRLYPVTLYPFHPLESPFATARERSNLRSCCPGLIADLCSSPTDHGSVLQSYPPRPAAPRPSLCPRRRLRTSKNPALHESPPLPRPYEQQAPRGSCWRRGGENADRLAGLEQDPASLVDCSPDASSVTTAGRTAG